METIGYIAVWGVIALLFFFSMVTGFATMMGAPRYVSGNRGLIAFVVALVLTIIMLN